MVNHFFGLHAPKALLPNVQPRRCGPGGGGPGGGGGRGRGGRRRERLRECAGRAAGKFSVRARAVWWLQARRRCARAPALTSKIGWWQMPCIFVRTLNGSVSVPQEGSVQDLKEQIEARSGFAAEAVRLAYNGHILEDDELLEELESQITLDL